MAQFAPAWNITKHTEGGYVNDPKDSGGETYRGVTRLNFPSWKGWPLINKRLPLKTNYVSNELDTLAGEFYQKAFWGAILGKYITNQQTANVIFDQAVIGGTGRTNDFIKFILNRRFGGRFIFNGKTDLDVIRFLNSVDQAEFIKAFNLARRKFFLFSAGKLAKSDDHYNLFFKYNKKTNEYKAKNEKFLAGWIKRVDKYGSDSPADKGGRVAEILTGVTFLGFGVFIERHFHS